MKILLIGGTGQIGTSVTRLLHARGHDRHARSHFRRATSAALRRPHAATVRAFQDFPGNFTDSHGRTAIRIAPHEVCIVSLG